MWSSPGSSTKRAPGIRSAIQRPSSTLASRSSVRCMTSVGAWIAGSTLRHVDLRVHAQQRDRRARAGAAAQIRARAPLEPPRRRSARASPRPCRSPRSARAPRSRARAPPAWAPTGSPGSRCASRRSRTCRARPSARDRSRRRATLRLPPSEKPNSAARSEPAASRTARTSSMRCSSVGSRSSGTRSDMPGAALVEEDQPREATRAGRGSARAPGPPSMSSTFEIQPGT